MNLNRNVESWACLLTLSLANPIPSFPSRITHHLVFFTRTSFQPKNDTGYQRFFIAQLPMRNFRNELIQMLNNLNPVAPINLTVPPDIKKE